MWLLFRFAVQVATAGDDARHTKCTGILGDLELEVVEVLASGILLFYGKRYAVLRFRFNRYQRVAHLVTELRSNPSAHLRVLAVAVSLRVLVQCTPDAHLALLGYRTKFVQNGGALLLVVDTRKQVAQAVDKHYIRLDGIDGQLYQLVAFLVSLDAIVLRHVLKPQHGKPIARKGLVHIHIAKPVHAAQHLGRVQALHLGVNIEHLWRVAQVVDGAVGHLQPRQVLPCSLAGVAAQDGRHQLCKNERFAVLFLTTDGPKAAHRREGHPVVLQHVVRLGIVLSRVEQIWSQRVPSDFLRRSQGLHVVVLLFTHN